MTKTTAIRGYHAHVYFQSDSKERARTVVTAAGELFEVGVGHMHDGPVGPHPMASCQLSATPTQFAALLPWLALNRDGLIVFCHPDTGEHLADHRDRGIWLGTGLELDLSIFDRLPS